MPGPYPPVFSLIEFILDLVTYTLHLANFCAEALAAVKPKPQHVLDVDGNPVRTYVASEPAKDVPTAGGA